MSKKSFSYKIKDFSLLKDHFFFNRSQHTIKSNSLNRCSSSWYMDLELVDSICRN